MYIEDLIHTVYDNGIKLNTWENGLIFSIIELEFKGYSMTEKQASHVVRILKRYQLEINNLLKTDVGPYLSAPVYKLPLRVIPTDSFVKIEDHPEWKRSINVKFPYNEKLITEFKNHRINLVTSWDQEQKTWKFPLHERSIAFISKWLEGKNFDYDPEFLKYKSDVERIVSNIEDHIPMLALDNGIPCYVNAPEYLPELPTDSIISALIAAKNHGVFTWSDTIETYLNDSNVDPIVLKYIRQETGKPLEIDSLQYRPSALRHLIKYLTPCLFIIPGGSEFEKLDSIVKFLSYEGYNNDEMSVMFRLPNASGATFNHYVKTNQLNSSISEKTKFVFVSTKLPKPVLDSGIKFKGVISMGQSNVHYTIRNFIKARHNLIYYCGQTKQKVFNFGNL